MPTSVMAILLTGYMIKIEMYCPLVAIPVTLFHFYDPYSNVIFLICLIWWSLNIQTRRVQVLRKF